MAGALNGFKASIKSKRPVEEHLIDDLVTLAGLAGEEDAQRAFAEFLLLSQD